MNASEYSADQSGVWPPKIDIIPGGNIDLNSSKDHAEVMGAITACGGSDIVDYYPVICGIHGDQNLKAFFFFKFPRETYEMVKDSPATLFATTCFQASTAPIVCFQVEFITRQFVRDVYSQLNTLRQFRYSKDTFQFEPPEPVYSEGVLNILSVPERRKMIALENQDVWLQVVAPSDLSEVHFLQTKVDPRTIKNTREQAEEYVRQIGNTSADFDSAYEHFRKFAPRPGLTIYGCFKDYKAGGKMVVADTLNFESKLKDWIFRGLGLGEVFGAW